MKKLAAPRKFGQYVNQCESSIEYDLSLMVFMLKHKVSITTAVTLAIASIMRVWGGDALFTAVR